MSDIGARIENSPKKLGPKTKEATMVRRNIRRLAPPKER
jgi:hypothetical protein